MLYATFCTGILTLALRLKTHCFLSNQMAQSIYGIHPVREALKSPHAQIEKIWIGIKRPHPSFQVILDLARARKIPVVTTGRETLDRMAGGSVHQNVVAIIQGIPYADIEQILLHWKEQKTRGLFLILDGIQDPQNFGSLVRTALGCGVQGIIIPKDRAVGITPAVIKASAGATAHLPIARVVNIAMAVETLKHEGIWVYGAAGEASDAIYNLDLDIDLAIVLGAEGRGMRSLVKKKCDRLFSIPMKGPVSSFNVSVAGGMILYEIMRQRSGR
jgi:23S rRNA (guanosine2251-2'-O)-methyltransferase